MDYFESNKSASAELFNLLRLRFEPIAVKFIENESDVCENAIRPKRDMGKRMSLCQALALTRRDRKTIYMDKTSEWCWCPMVTLGLAECDEGSEAFEIICSVLGFADIEMARAFFAKFPKLPYGKYKGIVTAPLGECAFEPDLVLIYCNNAQLRNMVWAVKNTSGSVVRTQIDAIDSCVYSCVEPFMSGEFRVTLPDIGEYERAGADENEIILSVPGTRLNELLDGMRPFTGFGMGYTQLSKSMLFDFERPPFYDELFKLWNAMDD